MEAGSLVHGGRSGGHPELAEDRPQMGVDGSRAEHEPVGNITLAR
jgi:hypothetical protein